MLHQFDQAAYCKDKEIAKLAVSVRLFGKGDKYIYFKLTNFLIQ